MLQPALFLHFCLTFPEPSSLIRERRYLAPLLYLPGLVIGIVHVLVALNILVLPLPLTQVRWVLDRVELFYLGAYFLAGALLAPRLCARGRSAAETPVEMGHARHLGGDRALCHFLCAALFPGLRAQHLDERHGPVPRDSAHHLRLRHRALPPDGRRHRLPARHLLYARHGGNCGSVFWRACLLCRFLPRDPAPD